VKRLLIALLCAAIATGAFAQLSPTIPTTTVQVWTFRESAVAPPVSTSGYAKLYVDSNGDAWYSKNGGAFAKLPFAASTFVASFNGRTGTVVPTTGDYSVAQVTGAESSAHAASTYAPIASPTFTGTVTIPSPFTLGATSITVTGTEINRLAGVTSAIQTQIDAKAPLASPALTGVPTAPTAALNTNTTQLATTAFVRSQITADAPVASVFGRTGAVVKQAGDYAVADVTGAAPTASPTFTGTVTIPTPFTLGAVSVTTTGTVLNLIAAATGTTGTNTSNIVFSASPTITGHPTVEGVTSTGATGSGKFVYDTSPALTTPSLGVASATSTTINGTGGAGFVEFQPQSSNPSAPASGYRMFADSSGRHAWKRPDGFVRTFDSTLTADRVYTWPDAATKVPIFGQFITFSGPTAARTVTLPDGDTTVVSASQPFTFNGTTAARTFTFVDQNDTFAFLGTANIFTKRQTITSTAAAGANEPSLTVAYTSGNLNGTQYGVSVTGNFAAALNGASMLINSSLTALRSGSAGGPGFSGYFEAVEATTTARTFVGLFGRASTNGSSSASHRLYGVFGSAGDNGAGTALEAIGVFGKAKRTSTTNGAGVVGRITTNTGVPITGITEDINTSAAGLFDNGDTALPELIGQNNATTNWRIGSTGDVTGGSVKTLTESSATAYVALNVPNSDGCAGKIVYTVFAKDATNTQIVSGELFFSAVANSTGTVTAATLSDQHNLNPVSSGTLTNTMTQTTAANTLTLNANAVSSLTQTTLEIRYRVESQGGNCSTITAQ
jgi:hypothetical protein